MKILPPRVRRDALVRPRLSLGRDGLLAEPSVVVHAPAGFGKTSLLAQWRRELLGIGASVAWLWASETDNPTELLHGLILSFRAAALRPTFGHTLMGATDSKGIEQYSELLAEITQSAVDAAFIVDEADRLPADSREALSYILRNLPGNLRIFLGMRSMSGYEIDDLIAYGQCATVTTSALSFQLDESIELFRQRFGDGFDPDIAAQIHELTAGWPLGLQLAISAGLNARSAASLASELAGSAGDFQERFVALLLANLDSEDVDFLTRISILDDFTHDFCNVVTGTADARPRLDRIARTTPVVQLAERSDWMRLHAVAREALLLKFADLPAAERHDLHRRAAEWLATNGMPAKAAEHLLAIGETDPALDLAERSLYDSLMTRGQLGQVRNWLAVVPDEGLDRRPRLLLAAAWALALSERHDEASRLVDRIMAGAGDDASLRCECALILGGAAAYADDPDLFARLHDPWALDPPLSDPLLLKIHANRFAFRALLDGEPALARLRQQRAPRPGSLPEMSYLSRWNDFIIGLSYLWEGQVRLAEKIIRPALLQCEADLGRRNAFTSMMAALLAAAMWERDQPEEARVLLADRMDVLEKSGLPEALMLAYRTLIRIAWSQGDEDRALELLGALEAVGLHRHLPRLRVISLVEQVRLHARGFRGETCRNLAARLDAFLDTNTAQHGPMWRRSIAIQVELAHGYAAVAARDWRAATAPFERANELARSYKQERLVIETLGMRALILERLGENAQALMREAQELARTYGLQRVFADAHPMLGDLARRLLAGTGGSEPAAGIPRTAPEPPAERKTAMTTHRASVLTPKEWEVLELLARSLSNKEIGRALDIHEETVKWHVKNLFVKLDAGSRKHVVSRARLMGFLA
ncbi:LuxR C-terminal-related transcriptional regulator [Mesorhizobium sp. L-8-10]|uniref:LuxR C-terminal-related transcriptional regulator n=1 Tax=Mesorhizobium sp. L-8-10 TaxID=2744523 RepID=UPI001927B936|nr:LuxR C-terminal-related transcriptional regulator [Mesorhizobium sp. L-8-10]